MILIPAGLSTSLNCYTFTRFLHKSQMCPSVWKMLLPETREKDFTDPRVDVRSLPAPGALWIDFVASSLWWNLYIYGCLKGKYVHFNILKLCQAKLQKSFWNRRNEANRCPHTVSQSVSYVLCRPELRSDSCYKKRSNNINVKMVDYLIVWISNKLGPVNVFTSTRHVGEVRQQQSLHKVNQSSCVKEQMCNVRERLRFTVC